MSDETKGQTPRRKTPPKPRKAAPRARAAKKSEADAAVAALNPEIAVEKHITPPVEEETVRVRRPFAPSAAGLLARRVTLAALFVIALFVPKILDQVKDRWLALGVIYAIVGLSINVLMGYAGQISLGHQGFFGFGALASAIIVSKAHMPFLAALIVAGATSAAAAFLIGIVALRLKGLYLALVTLAFGAIAESSVFTIGAITGGGAGTDAPRPAGFGSDRAYVYLCMALLGVLLVVDWRLIKSKAGRAILAIRENELAAASFGINVVAYKLMAFVISGVFVGIAGSLFAHLNGLANGSDFDFTLALTFVLMVVVGGLGSRVGIFIGSAFFAIFPLAMNGVHVPNWLGNAFHTTQWADLVPLIGALLLLLTLTLNPGGIAQQLRPITDWFAGKRFTLKHSDQSVAGGVDVRP